MAASRRSPGECGFVLHGGRKRRLYLFAVVLGCSRYMWAEFPVSFWSIT